MSDPYAKVIPMMNINEPVRISKSELEIEFGFPISDEEFSTAHWCEVCKVWAIFFDAFDPYNISCACA